MVCHNRLGRDEGDVVSVWWMSWIGLRRVGGWWLVEWANGSAGVGWDAWRNELGVIEFHWVILAIPNNIQNVNTHFPNSPVRIYKKQTFTSVRQDVSNFFDEQNRSSFKCLIIIVMDPRKNISENLFCCESRNTIIYKKYGYHIWLIEIQRFVRSVQFCAILVCSEWLCLMCCALCNFVF